MIRLLLILGLMSFSNPVSANPDAVQLLNDMRASNNRNALRYSEELEALALRHAQDMQRWGKLTHKGASGEKMSRRIKKAGYRACAVAENIAQGSWGVDGVFNAWKASAPHRKNMLNRKVREFGFARSSGGYHVLILAEPC